MKEAATNAKRRIWIGSAMAVVVVLALASLLSSRTPPPVAEPLPQPNGYDDLAAAGRMLPSMKVGWEDLNVDQLRSALATNQPALRLAREGLAKKCRIPVTNTVSYINVHIPDLAGLKSLARAFAAQGKLDEIDGKNGEAAKDYATTVDLGVEASRGGFMIDGLVGIAIENIGVSPLKTVAPELNAEQCRASLAILEKADKERDSFDKIRQTEGRFSREAGTLVERMVETALRLVGRDPMTAAISKFRSKYLATQKRVIEVETLLAARAFELEKGRAAKGWDDLVPGYLPGVPQEPGTNGAMTFEAGMQ